MARGSSPATVIHMLHMVAVLLLSTRTETDVLAAAVGGSWCIARSESSSASLQTALDYACGHGADCGPIEASGLCYLPNTLQAHASYAFNSYYQRSNYAPGSCDFAGIATVSITDPSYGSCTYPATPSSAGGVLTPPSTNTPGVVTITPITSPSNSTPMTNNPANESGSPVFGPDGGGDASDLPPDFSGTYQRILLSMFISCLFLPLFI